MRTFELYLDESGGFVKEKNQKSPSLIGGLLIRNGNLMMEDANRIRNIASSQVDGEYKHINDIVQNNPENAGRVAIEIMRAIKELPAQFVIFQNEELLDFEDDEKLYLHIMVEGIMNLLEKLSLEKPDEISINITAAVRRDLKSDDVKAVTNIEKYTKLIKERILMRLTEKDLFISKNCHVTFKLSSARTNAKLSLADVVCNSMLTKDSNKFTSEEKEELKKMFSESKYVFSVERPNIQKKLSNYLVQNNIADAFFLLNEIGEEKKQEELESLLINHINNMPIVNMRIQFSLLSLKIRSLIDVQRELDLCRNFLLKMQDRILIKINGNDFVIKKLKLDVALYLLTIYTHEANYQRALDQIEVCKTELKKISGSWEFLDYYYILVIREAITYSSCFQENKAIEILSEAITSLEIVMNSFKGIKEFGTMQSDNLAKALGTRLQSYINLIYPELDADLKKEYYEKAVKDSDMAIAQFASLSDKKRQYQYRSTLEASVGHIDNALNFLGKAVDTNGQDFNKIISNIAKIGDFSKHFLINAYFIIINNAISAKQNKIATEMYDAFINNQELYNLYMLGTYNDEDTYNQEKINTEIHPFEVLYFQIGKYLINKDKKLAEEYLNYALNICYKMNDTGVQIFTLSILADLVKASENKEEAKKTLIKRYETLVDENANTPIEEYLNSFLDDFSSLESISDYNDIDKILTKISNRIKV